MAKPLFPDLAGLVEILACRPMLTRKDVARRYGVHLNTVDRWHDDGTLPPARFINRGKAGKWGPLWRACDLDAIEASEKLLRRHKAKL